MNYRVLKEVPGEGFVPTGEVVSAEELPVIQEQVQSLEGSYAFEAIDAQP